MAMACSLQGAAQDSAKLMAVANDAQGVAMAEAPVGLESKLRFAEDGVEVYSAETLEAVFHYSDLSNISFRYDSGSGVATPVSDSELRLRSNPVAENLEFIGFSGEPVSLSVCGLKGELLVDVPAWSGQSVDVSALAPGLYLAKVGGKSTFKFIKK